MGIYLISTKMDNYLETDAKINFKKGMTLSQYMQELKPQDNDATQDEIPESTDDLYQTCAVQYQRSPSTKLIPFNIPEMDQDNYESSVDFAPETPVFKGNQEETLQEEQTLTHKQKSVKKNEIQITTMYNPKHKEKTQTRMDKQLPKDYRIKHLSNSPFKKEQQFTPTKNSLSKTLYGNTFLSNNSTNMSTASSTLYQSKLAKLTEKLVPVDTQLSNKATIHSREYKNEKYFHKKNKRDIDNLIQYENNIRLKYNSKINILDFRVEGLKDKLYERKNRIFH